ncbi:class I SAM-dependent methyltransferase [Trichocoleus sp. FACHB-262]|uniref:class I SAM-dependent methyltransferase n=1 Tax=Trichocoleus sp. FACHB-262 TaxID=2692869 RepID=UPI0016896808|nr:class I SAM-dependent methyltransferase [Trichocoleus sp. FACHB-262]MBD2124436.1 class I SAM-dependent methyltransferase [Trichocoleus sp. FACHB-262]
MNYAGQVSSSMSPNNYSEAISLYQSRIEAEPSVMSNYWHLGLVLLLSGQESEAQLTWLSAMAQGTAEETQTMTVELGRVLSEAAQLQEQKDRWQSAWLIRCYIHEFIPEDLNNLLALTWLSFQINLFEAEGEKLLPQIVYGLSFLKKGQEQSLNLDYLKQVLKNLLLINPFCELFEVCLIKNEGISHHPIFAEIRDELAITYSIVGVALNRQNLLSQSLPLFRKALQIQVNLSADNVARIYCNSGFTQIKLQQFNQAKKDLQKAIEADAQNPDVIDSLNFLSYKISVQEKGYSFTSDWFSGNISVWQKCFQAFVDQPNLNFLEIGSWEGRSTCWLLENILTHPSSKITCVDTFQGSFEHQSYDTERINSLENRFDFNTQRSGFAEKVEKIVGLSHQVLPTLPIDYYDLIYIDGSHLACDVLVDAVLSWRLAKVKGILVFDDYDFQFPEDPAQNTKIGIDGFINSFMPKVEIIHSGYQLIVKKIAV